MIRKSTVALQEVRNANRQDEHVALGQICAPSSIAKHTFMALLYMVNNTA